MRLRGTKLRIALAVAGGSALLAGPTLTRAAMSGSNAYSTSAPGLSPVIQGNLRKIGLALSTYATDNMGIYPPRLSMLYPTLISDPAVFWNPGDSDPCPITIDNDEPNQPNSTQISFFYFGGNADHSPTCVVVQDNSLANNSSLGVYVLTVDGVVEFFERSDRFLPPSEVARSNLRLIGQALHTYANDNLDHFPDKLSKLYPVRITDPTVFWNPGDHYPWSVPAPTTIDNDLINQANSAQTSYHYLGAGHTMGCDPGVILVADNALLNNGGTGMNILTADGVAEYYAPAPPSCQYAFECTNLAASRLRQLGVALYAYASDNSGRLPPRLSTLDPHKLFRPTLFWHPGDSDPYPLTIDNDDLNQPNSAQISFEFVAAGQDLDLLGPNEILLRDNTPANNGGNGILVLYADSRVSYVPIRSVASVAITGPATVPEGGTAAYTCTATYDDATTRDVTPGTIWQLSSGPGGFSGPGTYVASTTISADTPAIIHAIYKDEGGVTREADKSITVIADHPGDFDLSGHVDQDDVTIFESCAGGPGMPYADTCLLPSDGLGRVAADFDTDSDIDQADFGVLQRCLTGPDAPADPACAD